MNAKTIVFHRKTNLKKLFRTTLTILLVATVAFISCSNYSYYLTGSYFSSWYKNIYFNHTNHSRINNQNNTLFFNSSFLQNLILKISLSNSSKIEKNLSTINDLISKKDNKPECPLIPPNLGTRIVLNLAHKPLNQIEYEYRTKYTDLKLGGMWSPKECKARYKVAIIVPYRDRLENLELFLMHMHPFLQKQQLEYGIYLIEPHANLTFNRGFLMNIGFVESLKDTNKWQCHVFHDVDLLPEDERNIYSCPETPRHMSSAVSTLKYRLPYEKIFGGVTEFSREQFEKINGFSNLFFGWGGEDDDIRERVVKKGYSIARYPLEIGRYHMASHSKDKPNPERFNLLKTSDKRIDQDGVSSLKYDVTSVIKNKLFTKILVAYNQNEILQNNNQTNSTSSKSS